MREDEFLAKLADAETPLYPSCASHSKLSAIVSLFRLKTQNGWSDKSFNELLETLPSMLPEDNVLHTSLYDVKKFLKSFHMGYEKIHACVNDCCLFRKGLKKLDPKCKTSRWKTNFQTGELKKGVPQKVLRYFPIIPRLKRMFRSEQTAKELRWHFTNKSNDAKLRHPVDSVTWDQMNSKYPLFAAESRNIRLGLSTDGFNPFSMKNTRYSCWPVLLVNYNMAPDLCMKKENILLSLLIPGPYQPGNSIDVYLEPLIDDLQRLWDIGEQTYDAFSKTTFTMKAMLLWTISDLPAYGNLAGCRVKGKMGCPLCGKHTDSLWLPNSRKHVYMCHRKGLSPTHSYRGKKAWFDGKVEYGRKGRILTGHNISVLLKNYKNEFGNVRQAGKKRKRVIPAESLADSEDEESESEEEEEIDEEELSRWKKRSIFFNLPYWEELPVRHNLDVMHVERNVAASIISTLLHCGNSKDGLNARKDLQVLGIRKELHPKARGKRTYLPAAPWTLSKEEKRLFCKRLHEFKGPDGYCSNISRHMKLLKDYVRNPARPEGCIAESYLAEECMQFCRDFLRKTTSVEDRQERNTEYESTSILEGRPISAGRSITLSEVEKKTAHLAVIQNTALIPLDSTEHDDTLKWISYGPRNMARSYTGYVVNGLRFHTTSVQRQTQNSGVYYEATAMCRASARDTSQIVDLVSYYGRVVDIILLDYNVFYIPLFRCQWAVRGNGVKVDEGFTLVNLNQSQVSFARDPFILASQAKQIFYSREDESSNWYVVMRGPSRRYTKADSDEADAGPLPLSVDMNVEDVDAEDQPARVDCEGIYV
ncbi:uncharacterized protein LOC112085889 [Eutrema salsugineum]|uniref:uncharacterized protein LOC112085889 n=1 Tax=Eutrema salsugineum TaxID=72664 RepID=UPI000CED75C2|nr:uncharacterized protein LOC112085889 [Eutrema salsugineum]